MIDQSASPSRASALLKILQIKWIAQKTNIISNDFIAEMKGIMKCQLQHLCMS